jgi:hypothetical protein
VAWGRPAPLKPLSLPRDVSAIFQNSLRRSLRPLALAPQHLKIIFPVRQLLRPGWRLGPLLALGQYRFLTMRDLQSKL